MKKKKDQIKPEVEEIETDSLEENFLDQDLDIEDLLRKIELDNDDSPEDPIEYLQASWMK